MKKIGFMCFFIFLVTAFTFVPTMQQSGVAEPLEGDDERHVFRHLGLEGYMDRNGNVVIDAQFEQAYSFVEGAARVNRRLPGLFSTIENPLRWGFIDINGNLIAPLEFASAEDFYKGIAQVVDDEGTLLRDYGTAFYIDMEGNKVPQEVVDSTQINVGITPIMISGPSRPMPNPPPMVYSYIDSNGELATSKTFEAAQPFIDGLAIVMNGDKLGVIDTNFDLVIDYIYDNLRNVDTDRFMAWIKGSGWILLDYKGNLIAELPFSPFWDFSEGLAPVSISWGSHGAYIDRDGNVLLDSRFSRTTHFYDGLACVEDMETGKWGVIDREGNYVLEPIYRDLEMSTSGLVRVYESFHNDYYIDLQGNRVGPKLIAGYSASPWALDELSKADERSLIPAILRKQDLRDDITREEFAEAALHMWQFLSGGVAVIPVRNPFTDTDNENVIMAYNLGIVQGFGDASFRPDELVTREQMAVMLVRALRRVEPDADYSTAGAPEFSDTDEISGWALDESLYLARLGVILGSEGRFSPKGNATREMALLMSVRTAEAMR